MPRTSWGLFRKQIMTFKVTTTAHAGRFGQHTSIDVLGIFCTRSEAEKAAADFGLECRVSAYKLTPNEAARAAKLATFGVAYKPASVEDNNGWGKPAPTDQAQSIKEDRTAKLLEMNTAALVAELAKRKPNQAEITRLRGNITKLGASK
jgi:hypothetical protein